MTPRNPFFLTPRRFSLAALLLAAFLTNSHASAPVGNWTVATGNTSDSSPAVDEAVPLQATVTVSPPKITIESYVAGTFTISRKDPAATTWTQQASGVTLSAGGTWSDTSVTVGTTYEYQFVNTAGASANNDGTVIYPSGYIISGIQVDQTQPKGLFGVIVASDLPGNLPTEYGQYKTDLMDDGWQVREIQVPRAPNYNGVGVGGIATVTVTNGGTTSIATNSQVLLTDSAGKQALATATVSSNTIKSISMAVANGGVGAPGNEGANFTVGDTLTVSGGSIAGTGAELTAIVGGSNLALTSANPITGGSGYTNGQSVTLTGLSSGATTTVTINTTTGGAINYFTITGSTTGFINGELLKMTGNTTGSGVGPLTTYVYSGTLEYIYVNASGTGYTQGETGTLTGVTSGATAQVTLYVYNGYIDGCDVVSSQSGFISGEQLTLSNTATGSGAPPFQGYYGGTLTGVTVAAGGSGYTNGALVQLTYGTASATATLSVTSGAITGVTNITNATSGFYSGGYLTIGPTTSGATVTVATLDNSLLGYPVAISNGGSGYFDNDTVTIKGNSSGATAVGSLVAPSGTVTGVSVVLPNTFTAGETLTITTTLGGSGLAATVGTGAPVPNLIRSTLQQLYTTFSSTTPLKNIAMVGKVPVARSGINDGAGSDGHGNECPYGADAFYAEMLGSIGPTGDWTDLSNNITDIFTDVNMPGDGQYDQQTINQIDVNGDGMVQLGYGRIDLSSGIQTEVEAERTYFNKLHNYKMNAASFQPGRWVCDRLSYPNEREADLQSMPGTVGMSNIAFITGTQLPTVQAGQDSDAAYTAQNGPFLFYFKGSGGPGLSVGGKACFWTGMQSHWGYWYQGSLLSSGSNDMQINLSENNFTHDYTWNIWGMRYIYHRLGMGYDFGDMMKTSINNQGWTTGPYTYCFNNTSNGDYSGALYMDQMGDPAMRLFMFAPPTALSVVKKNGNAVLTWTASTDSTVTGYQVYRASYLNGQFTRLTSTPLTTTTYTDTSASSGSYVYMVRATRLETTGGGTYYNASLGTTQSINLSATPSTVTITSTSLPVANWNTAVNDQLTASGGVPQYNWTITNGSLPSGLNLSSLGLIYGSTSSVGSFTFTVQAQDQIGQTASQQLTLTVNQNTSNALYPEETTYTQQGNPTTSYGTQETAVVQGPVGTNETFHRYDLSSLSTYNGIAKATLYLYVTSSTTAPPANYAVVQASMIADSVDGWIANGISKAFSGVSSYSGGTATLVNCPAHGFITGTQITMAGLTGTGAPVGPYAITVIDANDFTIPVAYSSAWAYDPALAFATTTSMTYNTRPTTYDPTVPTLTATGTNTPGTLLSFDVTSYVKRALTFSDKKLGIRFFTGTKGQIVYTGTLNSYGNSIPYITVQATNAPNIVVNSPNPSPASINLGQSIYLSTTVTAIPANAANLTVQWSQVSGPGTATFARPTSQSTGVTFSAAGTYDLRITANDGQETSTQDINVIVLGATAAGPLDSLNLRLPFDTVTNNVTPDVSGQNNNGTFTVNPTTNPLPTITTSGEINSAVAFAAASANNGSGEGQSVVVTDPGSGATTNNLLDGLTQMSISFWFYANNFPNNGSNYAAVLCKRYAAFNNESYSFAFRGATGTNPATTAPMYWDFSGAGGTAATTFSAGQWYHIVAQFDGTTTTNNVQLYVNGYPDRFYSTTLTAVKRYTNANLHIGAYDANDTLGFNGTVDEVRIYHRLLTLTEIQQLAAGVPSDVGPQITTNTSLTGNVGVPLALSATVTDGGNPLTYAWSQSSGPATLTISNPTTLSASTTPTQPGSYGLLFTANDGYITTSANIGATITGQTYSSWATANGITGGQTGVAEPDGIKNLERYALGLNPTTIYNPGATGLPVVQIQNISGSNYLTLSFNGTATDVTYIVQATNNPTSGWTTIKTYPSGGTAPGNVTVQDTQAENVSNSRFMRLQMTNP
jgi:hypothetical protein